MHLAARILCSIWCPRYESHLMVREEGPSYNHEGRNIKSTFSSLYTRCLSTLSKDVKRNSALRSSTPRMPDPWLNSCHTWSHSSLSPVSRKCRDPLTFDVQDRQHSYHHRIQSMKACPATAFFSYYPKRLPFGLVDIRTIDDFPSHQAKVVICDLVRSEKLGLVKGSTPPRSHDDPREVLTDRKPTAWCMADHGYRPYARRMVRDYRTLWPFPRDR